ncbi:MAG: PorV/PorQ family protein [Alistipes shahii]
MSIYQSIKHFSATFLFATGGYAAQARTTDAGIMPFLGLETNARTAGMAGAATAVTDNPLAVYANAALSLIGERHAGGTLFSGPWNTAFDSANVLYGVGGFYTPDSRNSLLAGVRYFRGPSVGLTDEQGFPAGTARPQDLSAEVGYGHRIGRNPALSLTVRYVRSDQGFGEKPMQGVSFDIGAAYRGTLRAVKGARWIVGLRLADIGPNVKASDGERYGLPTRGSLGGSLHLPFRPNHVLGIALDLGHQFRGGITGLAAGAEYTFSGTVSCAADTTSVRRTKAPATTPRWVADSLQAPCGATPHGVSAVTNSTRSTTRFSFRSDFCCKRRSASIRKQRHLPMPLLFPLQVCYSSIRMQRTDAPRSE